MGFRSLDAEMRAMADALTLPQDQEQALDRIVRAAQDTLPRADYVSITVRHADGRLETVAASADVARQVDALQYELREGPCYDAVTENPAAYSSDLADDPSWPRFGPRAAAAGMRSQAGIRLADGGGTATSLNVYSHTPGALDDERELLEMFASHARVALGLAAELQTLRAALATRETIGKAVGIVMERYTLDSERSFEFLIRLSQNSNTKLRDVAATIVDIRPRDDDPGRQRVSGWDDVRRPGE